MRGLTVCVRCSGRVQAADDFGALLRTSLIQSNGFGGGGGGEQLNARE